jgi:FkbM family methyltransferase
MQFRFRENTYDASIFDFVVRQNEYELGDLSGKRILDVGGHIGCFALKAFRCNAEKIVSFEPNQENYDLAASNLKELGDKSEVVRAAVSRSDKQVEVRFEPSDDAVNSGGGCSVTGLGEVVPSISLDEAIEKYEPNWIKIDAEGAEFPALYTCTKLDQIETIIGEFHNGVGTQGMGTFMFEENTPEFLADFKGRLSMVELAKLLKEQGFRVLYEYTAGEQLGLFWASKNFDGLLVEPE